MSSPKRNDPLGVRPEKQIDGFLHSFAVSEGLFRATSLTANVVMTSMVAQVSGFGADGVLASAAVHLSVAAMLELPTGVLADRYGPDRAVSCGAMLKIATTLTFLGVKSFGKLVGDNLLVGQGPGKSDLSW